MFSISAAEAASFVLDVVGVVECNAPGVSTSGAFVGDDEDEDDNNEDDNNEDDNDENKVPTYFDTTPKSC